MSEPLLFLSHAGEEAAAARELARRLEQAGVPVWLDVERLRPGDRWMESLERALGEATAFAVYVGRSGVARWVGQEVRVALDRSVAEEGFAVIPVLGPGSDPGELPVFLRQRHWVDLRSGLGDAAGLRELAEVALGEDRRGERVRHSLLPPDRAPFLGLRTFGEDDAFLFYGRDREVEELLDRLGHAPFLAVVGASGCGKSSLVRAGLVPALRRGRPPGGAQPARGSDSALASWRIAVFRPADDPFRELVAALPDLAPDLTPPERLEVGVRLAERLGAPPAPGPEAVAGIEQAVAALVPAGTRTLLVVDQLEEAFTQTADAGVRRRFLDALLAAGRLGGDRPVHVLATLRADFYSRCWEHPELPRRIAANQYPVERMEREQLRDVIEKPLALAGVTPEPGLVDELLDDAGDEPGNLPLLEHALFQLWDQPAGHRFTHEAYRRMGALAGALEHHAEAVYAALDPDAQALARRLFPCLAVVSEAGAVTRRRVAKQDLLALAGEEADARGRAAALLDLLVERRLLTATGGGAEGETERVEVAHEALLRCWRRLAGWLEEDREFLLWRQRVAEAVTAWECSGRGEGELLRGSPLHRAEGWLERRPDDLAPAEEELIEASLAHERAERRREVVQARKLAAAVGGVALLLLLALAGTAWFNHREQRRSRLLEARGLAAQVATVAETRPQLGTLLALHSLRLARSAGATRLPEGETALREALDRLGGRVVGDPAEKVLAGAVTSGAVLLAVTDRGDAGGSLHLRRVPLPLPGDWRIEAGHAAAVLEGRVSRAVLAPSGRWLAASAETGPPRLWRIEAATGSPREVALDDEGGRALGAHAAWIALQPEGDRERLLVGALDGKTRAWALPAEATGGPLEVESATPSDDPKPADEPASVCETLHITWAGRRLQNPWRSPEDAGDPALSGPEAPIEGCAVGPGGLDRRLLTWDAREPARLWSLDAPPGLPRGPDPHRVLGFGRAGDDERAAIAPGGRWLAGLGPAGSGRVWKLAAGAPGRPAGCAPGWRSSGLAFSSDGGWLALQQAGSTALCTLDLETGAARSLAAAGKVQPDSVIAAGPELSWLVLFDPSGGATPVDPGCPQVPEPLRRHLRGPVLAAVGPDGRQLASADPLGILYLREVGGGEPCHAFRQVRSWTLGDRPATALALSRDALAVGRADGEVSLWDLRGGEDEGPRALVAHEAAIERLAFGPDGRRLASVDRAGRLLLWDLERPGDPVRLGRAGAVRALAFAAGGSTLLVARGGESGSGGRVDAFTLDLARLETLACRAAGRSLSPAEAREFLSDDDPPRVCPELPRGVDPGG